MRINIRPIVLSISILLVVFLFIPIFPVSAGYDGVVYRSALNFIIGVEITFLGMTETVGRFAGILVAFATIVSLWKCFDDENNARSGKGSYILTQLFCMAGWIWLTIDSWMYTVGLRKAIKSTYGLGDSNTGSYFWPFLMIILNIVCVIAYGFLNTDYAEMKNLDFKNRNNISIISPNENSMAKFWICKECNASNDLDSVYCAHCGKNRNDTTSGEKDNDKRDLWICSECGKENDAENGFCIGCGAARL